jgi:hypothetical protein
MSHRALWLIPASVTWQLAALHPSAPDRDVLEQAASSLRHREVARLVESVEAQVDVVRHGRPRTGTSSTVTADGLPGWPSHVLCRATNVGASHSSMPFSGAAPRTTASAADCLLISCGCADSFGEHRPPVLGHSAPCDDERLLVDLQPCSHRFQIGGDGQVLPMDGRTAAHSDSNCCSAVMTSRLPSSNTRRSCQRLALHALSRRRRAPCACYVARVPRLQSQTQPLTEHSELASRTKLVQAGGAIGAGLPARSLRHASPPRRTLDVFGGREALRIDSAKETPSRTFLIS